MNETPRDWREIERYILNPQTPIAHLRTLLAAHKGGSLHYNVFVANLTEKELYLRGYVCDFRKGRVQLHPREVAS